METIGWRNTLRILSGCIFVVGLACVAVFRPVKTKEQKIITKLRHHHGKKGHENEPIEEALAHAKINSLEKGKNLRMKLLITSIFLYLYQFFSFCFFFTYFRFDKTTFFNNRPVDRVVTPFFLGTGSLRFKSLLVKSNTVLPTARLPCNVYSIELCCSGAMTRRWALQTRNTLWHTTANLIPFHSSKFT